MTLVTYVLLYTPLKPKTSFATVVGAVPGALPPMIGWAAATGTLSREAWILFAIVFCWQMPHFLAIAWLFRDDYGRAGFPMLPVVEPDGRSTAYQVAVYASALVPVSLAPSLLGLAGPAYFLIALVLGLGFLFFSLRFADPPHAARRATALPRLDRLSAAGLDRDDRRPRQVMSVTDLPAVNATLNAVATVLLVTGWMFIKRDRSQAHRAAMLGALVASALFLTSYLVYHYHADRRFTDRGTIRVVYLAILFTHIVLAVAIVPLVLVTVSRALAQRFDRHRRIARHHAAPVALRVGDRRSPLRVRYRM